jgi:hypothetical protein
LGWPRSQLAQWTARLRWINRDARAGTQIIHALSDFLDDTRELVAEDKRRF